MPRPGLRWTATPGFVRGFARSSALIERRTKTLSCCLIALRLVWSGNLLTSRSRVTITEDDSAIAATDGVPEVRTFLSPWRNEFGPNRSPRSWPNPAEFGRIRPSRFRSNFSRHRATSAESASSLANPARMRGPKHALVPTLPLVVPRGRVGSRSTVRPGECHKRISVGCRLWVSSAAQGIGGAC